MNAHRTNRRENALSVSPAAEEIRPWLAIEQQRRLLSSYPLFFRAVRYPGAYPSNIANFGIRCGFGWYPIIDAAAREIEHELYTMWCAQAQAPEYLAFMDSHLLLETDTNDEMYPVIPFCSDIRETEGRLSISLVSGYLCSSEAWLRIRESVKRAEHRARSVCECCGKPGVLRRTYWHHVYCEQCAGPVILPTNEQPER
jgi:hypothetical protein